MLIDDLQEQLKYLEPDIQTIITFWKNAEFDKKILDLETKSLDPLVWQDPKQAYILKELQALRNKREDYEAINNNVSELHDMLDLFSTDESELEKLAIEVKTLEKLVRSFKIQLLLHEQNNCL